jgi:hypothetical protein
MRLTNGFSKKFENNRAAVGLHFAHYIYVRLHRTLRMMPAMAADVSSRLWSLEELVDRTDVAAASRDGALHAERKRVRDTLRNHYDALVDTKARAMKTTGVFATEHEHLEAAIVSLAYALDDYRGTV